MHFAEIKHQDRALSILRRSLASGRAHHAYLFDGPEGVGKELAGRALAAEVAVDGQAEVGDIVVDAHGEVTLRSVPAEFLEDRLDHRGRHLLR